MSLTDLSDVIFNSGFETAATISGRTVNGIFRTKYQNAKMFGIDVAASKNTFECRVSDVTGLAQDTAVVINSITYYLQVPEPQDEYRTLLILNTEQKR